jgi:hypothetical protein
VVDETTLTSISTCGGNEDMVPYNYSALDDIDGVRLVMSTPNSVFTYERVGD